MKQEITSKRNLNSKHFDNGDGTLIMSAHVGHIHYKNKQSRIFEDVDTNFLPTDYGWEMRKNNYELEIPKKSDGVFKFINSCQVDPHTGEDWDKPDEEVSFKPLGVSSVDGIITDNNVILYKNAYRNNIDLEVIAKNRGFTKEVVINEKPSDLSKDLEFSFEIDIGDLDIKPKVKNLYKEKKDVLAKIEDNKELIEKTRHYEDDLEREVWNKKNSFETSDSIILEKLRKTWFRKFNLYDSEGNLGLIKVRIEKKNNKIILTKILNKGFLENAVYPVRTDTTTNYYAGSGDGYVANDVNGAITQANWDTTHDAASGTSASDAGLVYAAIFIRGLTPDTIIYRSFMPIDTSGLTGGATISAATLKLYGEGLTDDYNGDGFDYIAVVETFQASTSTVANADFEDCGYGDSGESGGNASDANIVKGSGDTDITGLSLVAYNDITLNADGRGWIDKTGTTMIGTREGHDIEDDWVGDPGAANKLSRFRAHSEAEANKEPYLEVVYTVTASETGNMLSMFL